MMTLKFIPSSASREHLYNNWPDEWPDKANSVVQHDVTADQYTRLVDLVDRKASEREIERFLTNAREVLSLAIWMFSSGHHMSWIFPKQQIRPSSGSMGGLIPDYLMAGARSGGVDWFVLELKGADKLAFTRNRNRVWLSADANKGVCQLLNYIDRSSRDQAYLRDGLNLPGFREPRGILMIGTDGESNDPDVREFKSAWNNRMGSRVEIRSYNALLRQVEAKLRDFHRM
jgi:hypothetical protein